MPGGTPTYTRAEQAAELARVPEEVEAAMEWLSPCSPAYILGERPYYQVGVKFSVGFVCPPIIAD